MPNATEQPDVDAYFQETELAAALADARDLYSDMLQDERMAKAIDSANGVRLQLLAMEHGGEVLERLLALAADLVEARDSDAVQAIAQHSRLLSLAFQSAVFGDRVAAGLGRGAQLFEAEASLLRGLQPRDADAPAGVGPLFWAAVGNMLLNRELEAALAGQDSSAPEPRQAAPTLRDQFREVIAAVSYDLPARMLEHPGARDVALRLLDVLSNALRQPDLLETLGRRVPSPSRTMPTASAEGPASI